MATVLVSADGVRSQMAADIQEAATADSTTGAHAQTFSTLYQEDLDAVALNNDFVNSAPGSITIDNTTGEITITLATDNRLDEISAETLVYTPTYVSGTVVWDCSAPNTDTNDMDLLPPECRKIAP
ncbi:MAG: pilin [Gammaproteobacteria bacterium]|nr:pilin [Gammaproteobacteria bacterium]